MTKFNAAFLALSLTSTLFLNACLTEDEHTHAEPTKELHSNQVLIQTLHTSTIHAELYATDSAKVGYQKLEVCLQTLEHAPLANRTITLAPLMDMGMMNGMPMVHAAPIEQPTTKTDANGCASGAIVWLMMGEWSLKAISDTDTLNFAKINIINDTTRIKMAKDLQDTSRKIIVALINPTTPKVGMNDFEVAVFYKKDMMHYPADTTVKLVMTPEMPSMGHGSPNNVNPIHTSNGHYKGTVNFSMTGDWLVNLKLKNSQDSLRLSTGFWTNVK